MTTQRLPAVLFSAAVLLAVLWPIRENWQEKPKDNFPLSYYPMFSQKRDTAYEVNYIVGYDAAQRRYTIPYKTIGTGGFNQVRRQVNKQVKRGKAERLAKKTAKRVGKSKNTTLAELACLDVVTGVFHIDDYFRKGIRVPREERVLGSHQILQP